MAAGLPLYAGAGGARSIRIYSTCSHCCMWTAEAIASLEVGAPPRFGDLRQLRQAGSVRRASYLSDGTPSAGWRRCRSRER